MSNSQAFFNALMDISHAVTPVLGRFDPVFLSFAYSPAGEVKALCRIFMGIDSLFPNEDSMGILEEENPTFKDGQVPEIMVDCFAGLYARHLAYNAIEHNVVQMAALVHHVKDVNHVDNTVLQNHFINVVNHVVLDQLKYKV